MTRRARRGEFEPYSIEWYALADELVHDEDDLVSDDPEALPTQQSVKAYVDTQAPDWVRDFYNGTFAESFNALVTSDGATITMSVEQSGGGDLSMRFSDGVTVLDCTPAATIALTGGSDSSPQANYVYVLQSTKALTLSTAAWPAVEHIKVGYFLVPSAGYVQTNGVYVNQNWNDHAEDTVGQGHLSHMGERIRQDGAYYFSGIGGAGTDDYLTISGTTVDLKIGAGVVYQMHQHSVPAVDTSAGDIVHVKNWSGDAYHDVTNLYDIVADSTGATIPNNRYFNIVVWGVANKSGEYEPTIINLPGGTYVSQASAEQDIDGYDDYVIPREFAIDSSTGYLICRLTVQKKTATWEYKSTTDLRGTTPQSAGGGGVGDGATPFDKSDTTAGDYTINGTSFADVDNTLDLSVPAVAGDVLALSVSSRWSNEATFGRLDFEMVTSGNRASGTAATGEGIAAFGGPSGVLTNIGGVFYYTVVSGDISAGLVAIRLQANTFAATNKTLAASTIPLQISVLNIRQ